MLSNARQINITSTFEKQLRIRKDFCLWYWKEETRNWYVLMFCYFSLCRKKYWETRKWDLREYSFTKNTVKVSWGKRNWMDDLYLNIWFICWFFSCFLFSNLGNCCNLDKSIFLCISFLNCFGISGTRISIEWILRTLISVWRMLEWEYRWVYFINIHFYIERTRWEVKYKVNPHLEHLPRKMSY